MTRKILSVLEDSPIIAAIKDKDGISAALLAASNPIGTLFSSLFISYITVGGTKLSTQYYTKEIADVINCLQMLYISPNASDYQETIRQKIIRWASHLRENGGQKYETD